MPRKIINIALSNTPMAPLTVEQKAQVQAISPRLNLVDVSGMLNADRQGDLKTREQLDRILAQTEIYFGAPIPQNIIVRAPNLKWIQSPIAGTDQFLTPDVIASPVILTKAKMHEEQISENVFCFMLMLARRSFDHFRAQQSHKSVRVEPVILHGKTVGILGLGNIGMRVARIAKALNMRVLATKAHPEGKYHDVDTVYPSSGMTEVMSKSDFLVLLLPITPSTRNIIGDKELRLMKPTSFLINVSRGGIVDEAALAQALKEKRLAGAALDAFASDPGPIPEDSLLWDVPNLIMTPHNAGQRSDYGELVVRQFCLNLKRYLRGQEFIGTVNKELGY